MSTSGIKFRTGPFHIALTSSIPSVCAHLYQHYSEHPILDTGAFIDFHISVNRPTGLRAWIKPQVVFSLDGHQPFTPLPLAQAAAQFEWGLNWCVAGLSHQYLIIHSAVVEKDGISLIMPGQPGSGKSTLCAALLFEGWRLLSDEMALIELSDLTIQPVPRPVSLKNRSIDIIEKHQPGANFGPVIQGTTKGDVSHLQPPVTSVQHQRTKAKLQFIIFPKYHSNANTGIREKPKADACMALIENSFNFNILGAEGFHAITDVIDKTHCFEIEYRNLEQALTLINKITDTSQ
jgi:HprK-related kinase A